MGKEHRTEAWAQYMREVGDNLAYWRIVRGLSQEKVAFASHLSRYTYQRLEKGLLRSADPANPTLFTLVSLSETLAVPLSKILPDPSGSVTIRMNDPVGRNGWTLLGEDQDGK